jgi:hypothetical protein
MSTADRPANPGHQAPTHEYVGPALLTRTLADSTVRKFRGRIVRHKTTGALRFVVNHTSTYGFPKAWPGSSEWTDDFELKDIEWLGKRPEGL